jgi:hypothetical protein
VIDQESSPGGLIPEPYGVERGELDAVRVALAIVGSMRRHPAEKRL